jgi:hypothetical protein
VSSKPSGVDHRRTHVCHFSHQCSAFSCGYYVADAISFPRVTTSNSTLIHTRLTTFTFVQRISLSNALHIRSLHVPLSLLARRRRYRIHSPCVGAMIPMRVGWLYVGPPGYPPYWHFRVPHVVSVAFTSRITNLLLLSAHWGECSVFGNIPDRSP